MNDSGLDVPRMRLALGSETVADFAAAVSASLAYFVVVRIARAQETKHGDRGSEEASAARPSAADATP